MPHRLRPRTREQALGLWSFVGTTLAIMVGWIGGGYAVGGSSAAQGTNFHILKATIPGGMHAVGVIELLMSLGMVYAVLSPFDQRSKWTLRVFAGIAFLLGLSFAGSWIITDKIVWGGPILWMGIGVLAEGMVMYPPDALPVEDPDALAADDPRRRGQQLLGPQARADLRWSGSCRRHTPRAPVPARTNAARDPAPTP